MFNRVSIFILTVLLAVTVNLYAGRKSQEPAVDRSELVNDASPQKVEPGQGKADLPIKLKSDFDKAAISVQKKLEDSIAELKTLREQIANEKIPLNKELNGLEMELSQLKREYQGTAHLLDSSNLNVRNLKTKIESHKKQSAFLSTLLTDYIKKFEESLHICELDRYKEDIEKARLAPENANFSELDIFKVQASAFSRSLDRLEESVGGCAFDGTAVDENGKMHVGRFVLVGPAAVFRSNDGQVVGNVELRMGSLKPAVISYGNEDDSSAASKLVAISRGNFPIDPSGGNAHKMEETNETFLAHIQKGGPVMYPIFIMAGAALLVAIFKWFGLSLTRKPSKKQIDSLLKAVTAHNEKEIHDISDSIKGPVGEMLKTAVEHIKEPRDLIEEVMYEKVLATRLKLERFLPFIAICAASAPLLGLLGTVTGIINTFKLLTVFGSGDVKALSGGISEALITTEFGLIVAIPSLLLHAFLSRKAKGMINQMEKAAVALINQVSKTPYYRDKSVGHASGMTAEQIKQLMKNMNITASESEEEEKPFDDDSAGAMMDTKVLKISSNSTVADAIEKIRTADLESDVDSVFVVDESGKYIGNVLIRHLLIRPEDETVKTLVENKSVFVRSNTHKDEAVSLINNKGLARVPVLDQDDQLIGQFFNNGNGDGK
ncbi:MAG: MotA/TolQ/ExbB proton channel family protein [Phycisphaerae bacterium]|nr:MotA/TolQ/ExbB proton channel family protein [Phycisphaerae bacterium]